MTESFSTPARLSLDAMRSLSLTDPLIMGILNVTPDSFSDGGAYLNGAAAKEQAMRMLREGADIIDVGGESTRPGSQAVSAEEQIRRVCPAIQAVAKAASENRYERTIAISIDTTSAKVAQAAVEAGATMLNDVSGGLHDEGMFKLAANTGLPIVLMHMQGTPRTMQNDPTYDDVVMEVRDFLLQRAAAAEQAGVKRSQIVLDVGIGFGKTREHNLALLAGLNVFVATGYPILLGTSRKRFMGSLCRASWEKLNPANSTSTSPLPAADGSVNKPAPPAPDTLVGATCATTALGVAQGVQLFRVHDVMANRQAADVAKAVCQAEQSR